MDDDFVQYLLQRNYSKHPDDRLSDAQLRYLLQAQNAMPPQKYQALVKLAKTVLKQRRTLPEEEQRALRQADQQQYAAQDIGPAVPKSGAQLERTHEAPEQISLQAQLRELQAQNGALQGTCAGLMAENRQLHEQLENERQNAFQLTQQALALGKRLSAHEQFVAELSKFSVEKQDLSLIAQQLAARMNAVAVQKNALRLLRPELQALREEVERLRIICNARVDVDAVARAAKLCLRNYAAGERILRPVDAAPSGIITRQQTVLVCEPGEKPAVEHDVPLQRADLPRYLLSALQALLGEQKCYKLRLQGARQHLLNAVAQLQLAPFVLSAFYVDGSVLFDGIRPERRLESPAQALRVEINRNSELPQVVNLILRKCANQSIVGLCFQAQQSSAYSVVLVAEGLSVPGDFGCANVVEIIE